MINSRLSLSPPSPLPNHLFRMSHVPWGRHGAFLALSHHRPSQQYAVVAGQRPTKIPCTCTVHPAIDLCGRVKVVCCLVLIDSLLLLYSFIRPFRHLCLLIFCSLFYLVRFFLLFSSVLPKASCCNHDVIIFTYCFTRALGVLLGAEISIITI